MNIALFGAQGELGALLLKKFLQNGDFVYVYTDTPDALKIDSMKSSGVPYPTNRRWSGRSQRVTQWLSVRIFLLTESAKIGRHLLRTDWSIF